MTPPDMLKAASIQDPASRASSRGRPEFQIELRHVGGVEVVRELWLVEVGEAVEALA